MGVSGLQLVADRAAPQMRGDGSAEGAAGPLPPELARYPASDCDMKRSAEDKRAAPRYSLLIRPAKLICSRGEFLCVLRDISETGISLRTFHRLPSSSRMEIEMQNGDRFEIARVWQEGNEAGFRLVQPLNVDRVIAAQGSFPKRPLRIGIQLNAEIATTAASGEACLENLSQQGARILTSMPLALDQTVKLRADHLPETRAKIRWRKAGQHGLVFENTFALPDFALLAAALQCPQLVAP